MVRDKAHKPDQDVYEHTGRACWLPDLQEQQGQRGRIGFRPKLHPQAKSDRSCACKEWQ